MRLAYVVAGLIAFGASVADARVVTPNGRPALPSSVMDKRAPAEMNSTSEDVQPSQQDKMEGNRDSKRAGSDGEGRVHAFATRLMFKRAPGQMNSTNEDMLPSDQDKTGGNQETKKASSDGEGRVHAFAARPMSKRAPAQMNSTNEDVLPSEQDKPGGNQAPKKAGSDGEGRVHAFSTRDSHKHLGSAAAINATVATPSTQNQYQIIPVHPKTSETDEPQYLITVGHVISSDDGDVQPPSAAPGADEPQPAVALLRAIERFREEVAHEKDNSPVKTPSPFESAPVPAPSTGKFPIASNNVSPGGSSLPVLHDALARTHSLPSPPAGLPTDSASGIQDVPLAILSAPDSAAQEPSSLLNRVFDNFPSVQPPVPAGNPPAPLLVVPITNPAVGAPVKNASLPVDPSTLANRVASNLPPVIPSTDKSTGPPAVSPSLPVPSHLPLPVGNGGAPVNASSVPVDPSTLINRLASNMPAAASGAPLAAPSLPVPSSLPVPAATPSTPVNASSIPVDPSTLINRVASPSTDPTSVSVAPSITVQPAVGGNAGVNLSPSLSAAPSTVDPSTLPAPAIPNPAAVQTVGDATPAPSSPAPATNVADPAAPSLPAGQLAVDGSSRAVSDAPVAALPIAVSPPQPAQQPAAAPTVPSLPVAQPAAPAPAAVIQPAVEGNPTGVDNTPTVPTPSPQEPSTPSSATTPAVDPTTPAAVTTPATPSPISPPTA